jgi:stage II sporulation protein D
LSQTRLFVTFTFSFFVFLHAYAQEISYLPAKVRVKITSIQLPIQISANGIMVENTSFEKIQNASFIKEESIQINRHNEWKIQKNHQIISSSQRFLKIDSVSGRIKLGVFWYPTPLFLSAKTDHMADVILNLNFDQYLQGVLQGEMPAGWPYEALKAQAIAARSYALHQLKTHHDDVFHLQGNVLDQVYSLENSRSKEIVRAINETQNQILFQNDAPLKAYYHSDCGGQTEEPKNVWGVQELKIGTAVDPYCKFRKNHWSFKISKQKLASVLGLTQLEKILNIDKSVSGRIEMISFSDGIYNLKVSGQELRQKLGFDKLKSTLFSLTFDEDSVTFMGQGYGHGSGLCQWGARAMALEGKSAKEILSHYYPMAKVSRIEFENQGIKL